MIDQHVANPDRLFELLADRATQGLSIHEREELDTLLGEHPEVDPLDLDRAAAAIDLAFLVEHDPLPGDVRDRLERKAISWLADARGVRLVRDDAPAAPTALPHAPDRRSFWPWLIAAASLLLALFAWWPTSGVSVERRYAELTTDPGSTLVTWEDPDGRVTGDIVWNNARQTGIMRFRGLEPNDPRTRQYQLWIFDRGRAEISEEGRTYEAVDGGVFDVPPTDGDVYVEVDAKLDIHDPTLFAVTTEPPGGVVKHVETEEYRIILTAPEK